MEITEVSALESTISTEQDTEGATVSESATASQEQGNNGSTTEGEANASHESAGSEAGSNGADSEESLPFMTVQFNHEDRNLSKEEAVQFAQKGIKYDSMFSKVQRAAALRGQSIEAFCSSLEGLADEQYRLRLEAKYGDDQATIDELMELYQSKKEKSVADILQQQAEAERQERETFEGRLADEFIALQKEFPEIKDFNALPGSVKAAAAKGKDLFSEYLRFKHNEKKALESAKAGADAAKKASSGSMSTGEPAEGAFDALMKGIWG